MLVAVDRRLPLCGMKECSYNKTRSMQVLIVPYCAWTKLTEHPGERGNPSLLGSTKIITTQHAFLIKADGCYTKY